MSAPAKQFNRRLGIFPKRLLLLLSLLAPQQSAAFSRNPPAEASKFSLGNPLIVKWDYGIAQTLNLTPAVSGEAVYLPLPGGELVALRLSDGKLNWRTETGGEISAAPVADERVLYLASQTHGGVEGADKLEGSLRALSTGSGVAVWARRLSTPLKGSLVLTERGIFGLGTDNRLYAFDRETGSTRWILNHTSLLSVSPVAQGQNLYVGGADGSLLAIDQNSGGIVRRYRTRGALVTSAAVAGQRVFVSSADGDVYSFDESSGKTAWQVRNGVGVQTLVATPRGLIATSSDNFAYLLSLRRGKRLWKKQLPGRVAAPPAATADHSFFCPLSGDECLVLDLKNGRKVNRLIVGEDNNTSATPLLAGRVILLTTRRGVLALTNPGLN